MGIFYSSFRFYSMEDKIILVLY
ncbi:hypothetical protein OIU76_025049 [Salix suchowensis]|nr:hypothetical protein OIU76_025049 [Salix suchowensis]